METNGTTKNGKVPYSVFTSVIGMLIIALGWLFVSLAQANDRNQDTKDDVGELKVMMAEVKTNVSWIRETLGQNPTILKK